jgi:hypothetical protein
MLLSSSNSLSASPSTRSVSARPLACPRARPDCYSWPPRLTHTQNGAPFSRGISTRSGGH